MTDWRTTWLPDLDSDEWLENIDISSFKKSIGETELSRIDYFTARAFHNASYSQGLGMKLRSAIESTQLQLPVTGLITDETIVRDVSASDHSIIEKIFYEVVSRVNDFIEEERSNNLTLIKKALVKFLIDYGYTDPKYAHLTEILDNEIHQLIEEAFQIKLNYEMENESYDPNSLMVVCFRTFCGSRYSADKARKEFEELTSDLWHPNAVR